jgi:hypothetical protein
MLRLSSFLTSFFIFGFKPNRQDETSSEMPQHYTCEQVIKSIPPPPPNGQFYKMRAPLRNGPDVPKHRVLYVPEGKAIEIARTSDGKVSYHIPANTIVWKEFYLETGSGLFLVERRVLCVTEDSYAEENALPAPWRYATSHFWPKGYEGNFYTYVLDEKTSPREKLNQLIHAPTDVLPMQDLSGAKLLILRNQMGIEGRYNFPGLSLCAGCHGGANAKYPEEKTPQRILGFATHINNIRTDSLRIMEERGMVKGAEFLYEPEKLHIDEGKLMRLTTALNRIFDNNCTSCHTADQGAMGNHTNFKLTGLQDYPPLVLLEKLSTPVSIADRSGKMPLLDIEAPGRESELYYRLKGTEGRRRMPMIQGGVPHIDSELIKLIDEWVAALKESYSRERLSAVKAAGLRASPNQTFVVDRVGRTFVGR